MKKVLNASPAPLLPPPEYQGRGQEAQALCTGPKRAGFTLIEVLVTIMLMAIILPLISKGITLGTAAASDAKRRTEAAGLAQEKLAELLATGEWTTGNNSGDFSPNWPDYRWSATAQAWANDVNGTGLEEIDLTVTWTGRGKQSSLTLSTLASQTNTQSQTQ